MRMQPPEHKVVETIVITEVAVRPAPLGGRADPEGFSEWDRHEWVGEGQEPPDALPPARAETEPRWTKWEWVGEGQGARAPERRLPAARMPKGENGLSGFCHNPGMEHWGGRF